MISGSTGKTQISVRIFTTADRTAGKDKPASDASKGVKITITAMISAHPLLVAVSVVKQ
jgi:hypothetical protein